MRSEGDNVRTGAARRPGSPGRRRAAGAAVLVLILLTGALLRSSGLFRGLAEGVVFHPDAPKQVLMLSEFLQGRYVLYQDSLFYDGYPYGLNRVDELLIRPLQGAGRAAGEWLRPEAERAPERPRGTLYPWARTLRVCYGLAAVLLLYAAARRLRFRREIALAAALLYALAPLAATVTHSASGDVGLDLFLSLALWGMAGYVLSGAAAWILFAGAACGMAFACKYHGGLGLWIVGLPPLLLFFRRRETFGRLCRLGAAALAGWVAGALFLTPAFFFNAKKTWKDLRANVVFIRDYGAPADWLERPLAERIVQGLGRNLPFILGSLGWALAAGTLIAAVWLVFRRCGASGGRGAEAPAEQARSARREALLAAVAAFPPAVLLLSTALKPVVQPFHFSFLLPFMALSTVWLLDAFRDSGRRCLRFLATLLLLAAIGESLAVSLREQFFWRRSDTIADARRFAEVVFDPPLEVRHQYRRDEALKYFHAEPSRLPVFRNRSAGLVHPETGWWRRQHQLPVPSVPLPGRSEWIFLNGPVFPRSDRIFAVPATRAGGTRARRTLVFEQEPSELTIGLRSGRLPARYDVRISGRRFRGLLLPHSQILLKVDGLRARHASRDPAGRLAFPVPLSVGSRLGPVWVAVLEKDSEIAHYRAHGPEPPPPEEEGEGRLAPEEIARRLEGLRFIDGDPACLVLHPDRPTPLLTPTTPLAAGAYRLEAEVSNTGSAQTLHFEWANHDGFRTLPLPPREVIPPGRRRIVWSFQKAFVPYDAALHAVAERPGLRIDTWRIRPEPEVRGLRPRREAAERAEALAGWRPSPVVYPGIGVWRGLVFPGALVPGESFDYTVRFDPDPDIKHNVFHDAVLFLHLKNAEGRTVLHLDVPLPDAALAPDRIPWQRAEVPRDLPPGRYTLDAGLYHVRTRRRFSFPPAEPVQADRKRQVFRAAELRLAAP